MTLFKGLSAFPITPADAEGRVDATTLCSLLERLTAAKVDSIGLLGSTGTYAYLTREARRRAVEAAVGCVGGRIPIIVGVGALRTDEAQSLARDAEAAGADGLLLAPVSYTPLTDEEVYQHFVAVAGASGLPLCIYNNPTTTHFSFSEALLARLAALPTVKGAKMPLPKALDYGAEIGRLRAGAPADFAVGYSGDWGCPDAVLAGADAWYSVVAGLLPEPTVKLMRAAQAGDSVEVGRLRAQFEPLWDLFKAYGGLRVVYAAAHMLSLCETAPPRPILPCPEAALPRIAAAIEKAQAG